MKQEEVKILDLSPTIGTKYPQWMVRRAVEILLGNTEQVTLEELWSIADVLMREAGSRIVRGEEP